MTAGDAPPPAAPGGTPTPAAPGGTPPRPHDVAWPSPLWAPPPPLRRRRRGRGRLAMLAVAVLGVAALVGGTTLAVVSARRSAAPVGVVGRYFAALSAGDAPAALQFATPPAGDHEFLTSSVLAVQRRLAPISDVRVGSARVSGQHAVVPVTYTLSPRARPGRRDEQRASVALHRVGRGWQLDSAAATVRVVAVTAAHRATLGGAALPDSAVELFPGAVPIEYDTPFIEAASNTAYLALTSTGTVRVGAQLSVSGRSAVEGDVRAAFARCLAGGAKAPLSCPLTPSGSRVVPGSLRGAVSQASFTSVPQVQAADADGLVATAGTFTVHGQYQTLDFNNIASTRTGTAAVAFRAALYASAPAVVQWKQP